MKISIQKLQNGNVKIVLATASERKPLTAELTPEKLNLLLGMLKTAAASDAFEFSLTM